ncbi:PH (Pleckstrin Homology) domain-containing protein [Arcicella aurantiaca]|uniref:PH (Pleckstrin Homology) domain-containing protein n=1 Tax=Arcicella aurantiaca TaxID=591202 RepID=A0A316EZ79_9BACT|nr:PH domain-containing protein [Arcicella aurantiaca]PWK28575.1 PH (Pleckstrin Homology) domain-containing protein [Arcicella aurantiaca]
MKIFTTSLDQSTKITTSAVLVLIAGIVGFSIYKIGQTDQQILLISIIPIIIICLIAYAYRPNNYSVSDDKLLIHRLIGDVEIKRRDIQSVEMIDESKVRNSIRTFGSGGFFGSYGKFWNSTLGKMTWYVTRKDNFVLVITTEEEKILLTPDEPEAFVAFIKS